MRYARFADPTGDAPGEWIAHIADVGSILSVGVGLIRGMTYINHAGQHILTGVYVVERGSRSSGNSDTLIATLFDGRTAVTSRRGVRYYMTRIGQPWEQRLEMADLLGSEREEAF